MIDLSLLFKQAKSIFTKGISSLFGNAAQSSNKQPSFKLYQSDGYIHVFTDGSNSLKKARLGMGWIIKITPDDEILCWDIHERISGVTVDRQNIAAETLAVINCLQMLPEGSHVKLHTDYRDGL